VEASLALSNQALNIRPRQLSTQLVIICFHIRASDWSFCLPVFGCCLLLKGQLQLYFLVVLHSHAGYQSFRVVCACFVIQFTDALFFEVVV